MGEERSDMNKLSRENIARREGQTLQSDNFGEQRR